MGEDGCLKIGDFGLSRPEAAPTTPPDTTCSGADEQEDPLSPPVEELFDAAIIPRPDQPNSDGHTTGVGTASYASPEQLQGRRYGLRSDLFSLGLVLLELCCSFTTTHERAAAFQSMRSPNGAAPAHLAKRSPAIAALAELLCRTVPEKRPCASEALEKLDRLIGSCGCRACGGGRARAGSGAGSSGSGNESDDSSDARLREELAAKTRKVEEQVNCNYLLRHVCFLLVYRRCLRIEFSFSIAHCVPSSVGLHLWVK